MSELEARAKPLLINLLSSSAYVFTEADAYVFGRWAVKSAMVRNAADTRTPVYANSDHAVLADGARVPSGWSVWLAGANYFRFYDRCWSARIGWGDDDGTLDLVPFLQVTFQIHDLVIVIFKTSEDELDELHNAFRSVYPSYKQVWPYDVSVVLPGLPLTHSSEVEAAGEFIRELMGAPAMPEFPAEADPVSALRRRQTGRYDDQMEDGPEDAEGTYEYAGEVYTLVEHESERWMVWLRDRYLGRVIALSGTKESGPVYTIDIVGEEGKIDEPATDDWRRAVEALIDRATPAAP
jgi:hypothetical protein